MIRTCELIEQGLLPHEIRAQVRDGTLLRIRRGVYQRPDAQAPQDLDAEQRHLQLVAATMPGFGDGAVLSHQSAALVHELPIPARMLGPVHVTRPGHSGKVRPELHLHRAQLRSEQIVDGDHGPMTSLLQTTVDLTRSLPPVHGIAVVDAALRKGADRNELLQVVNARRNSGNVLARQLIHFADAASESVGESHSRWLMYELGIPAPVLQHTFSTPEGLFVARTDFYWPAYNVVGEFDGLVKYGRGLTPGQTVSQVVIAEKQREEAIRRQGPWMIRWGWSDLDDRAQFGSFLKRALRLGARAA